MFSGSPILSLILSVLLSPNTKNLFLQFTKSLDEPLSTPNLTTCRATKLPKLHDTAPTNAIP